MPAVSASSSPPSESALVQQLQQQLRWAELKIQALEEQPRLARIAKDGPASEKLSSAQLELLEGEPGVSREEVEAESQREPLPAVESQGRRQHPGRRELPAALPRVERIVPSPPEHCSCPGRGRETVVIGYEQSEQPDVKPAEYFVLVTKREKRVCRSCESGIRTAPLPARVIDKSPVSDRVIINAVIAKYSDYLPLYRQSAMLERATGLKISRAALDGWVLQGGVSRFFLRSARWAGSC